MIGMFVTRANANLLIYKSPIPDSIAWMEDAL